VLSRFREGSVAFMADIESMFYQVRVPPSDQTYLRFLWWPDGNLNAPLKEYMMTVHLFGAVSSPSVCSYALRRIAADHALCPSVATTISTNFYVDECLKSASDVDTAMKLMSEVQEGCARGGFRLTKFTCNVPAALSAVPLADRAASVRVDLDSLSDLSGVTEHALGVQWNLSDDTFSFKVDLPEKPLTRRGILSMASSLFDPLGFLAPLMLPIKCVFKVHALSLSVGTTLYRMIWSRSMSVGAKL
jgi:hypothetical protein